MLEYTHEGAVKDLTYQPELLGKGGIGMEQ